MPKHAIIVDSSISSRTVNFGDLFVTDEVTYTRSAQIYSMQEYRVLELIRSNRGITTEQVAASLKISDLAAFRITDALLERGAVLPNDNV
jgi:DNA-binding MarR family transcriptional regulator